MVSRPYEPLSIEDESQPQTAETDSWVSTCIWALTQYPARLTIYGITAFTLCYFLLGQIRIHGVAAYALENGPIERTQAFMAVFTSLCFFVAAWKMKVGRTGLIFCATMVGYAAARECDMFFEMLLFEDAYKYVVGIPMMLIALTAFWFGRKVVFPESLRLMRTPAATIFAIAGIYICSVCQIIDRPDLWQAIGEGPAAEITKAAVEEFCELFGYMLLTIAGIEAIAMAFSKQYRLTEEASIVSFNSQSREETRRRAA